MDKFWNQIFSKQKKYPQPKEVVVPQLPMGGGGEGIRLCGTYHQKPPHFFVTLYLRSPTNPCLALNHLNLSAALTDLEEVQRLVDDILASGRGCGAAG